MKGAGSEAGGSSRVATRTFDRARFAGLFTVLSLAAACGLLSSAANAQTNEWTWKAGSLAGGSFGVYGTLAAPAAGNAPGGRSQPVTWTDSKGNLWLFGGDGFDSVGNSSYLNDLWEFDPSNGEWSWMGGLSTVPFAVEVAPGVYGTLGTPAAGNIPSGRSGSVSWTDAKGDFWLFGGFSYGNTGKPAYFNDLWEFNPTLNEWAWVSGADTPNQSGIYGSLGTPSATNVPGARENALSWIDGKGNLWLFGGAGYDSAGNQGSLNDLWQFNPSTKEWTWINGATIVNQSTVPGTLQKPASGNAPGARNNAVGWIDHNGNFWLFGGYGFDSAGHVAFLNDVWEFNPSTGEWAWMNGSTLFSPTAPEAQGVYGTLQTPASGNVPGSRVGAQGWTDRQGNLWMFGGVGYDSTNTQGMLNDLWAFNPTTNQWAWMDGSTMVPAGCSTSYNWCGPLGVYGTLNTSAFGDVPGGRYDGASWTDASGNFWLFGGIGLDANGGSGYLNDVWTFQPNSSGEPITATPTISPDSGTYSSWQTVAIADTTPGATINYLVNGNAPALKYTGPITVSSSEAIEAIATASGYANSNIASASYTLDLLSAAAPTFSLASGTYSASQTVTISDTTPGAIIYVAVGSAPVPNFNVYSGPVTISSPESVSAFAVADGYFNSPVATAVYNIGTGQPSGKWVWDGGSSTVPPNCTSSGDCGEPGWYGILKTPAAGNFPGARYDPVQWTDSKGNLWLFGGDGYDSSDNQGLLNDLWEFNPTTSEWAWMSGSETTCNSGTGCGEAGVYGTVGTPTAKNTPGGREWAAAWADHSGHLWLFGGWGFDSKGTVGFLNDLWEFDPSANEWTWISGSSSTPCEACGVAGAYGTFATPATGNVPGARQQAAHWVDSNGNLWLFGGLGYDSRGDQCYLNDLWEFDISKQQWAWMGGSKFAAYYDLGLPGVYGTLGVPALNNVPGGRSEALSWADSNGHFWLFGGYAFDIYGNPVLMNDLWEFDPTTNEWTWMSGSSDDVDIGTYGILGTPSPSNVPGGRLDASTWADENGNLWLLGGGGEDASPTASGTLNDLWEFIPSLGEWVWMGGSNGYYAAGKYGTLGTPAAVNAPGARNGSASWIDNKGNLWLFGGNGYDSTGQHGLLNDFWQYGLNGPPSAPPPSPVATPVFSLTAGTYSSPQTLTISDQTPGATIYYTINGDAPNSGSTIYSGQLTVSASETIVAVAVASGHSNSPMAIAAYTINLPPAATPTFSVPSGTYYAPQTVTFTDTTAGATIYYTTNGSTPTTNSTVYAGPITVSTTSTINAIAAASGYANSAVASATYGFPSTFTIAASPGALTVNSGSQGNLTLTVTPQNGFNAAISFACSGQPASATCTFNPSSITPSGSAVTTQLTIAVSSQSASLRNESRPFLPTSALAVVFLLLGWRRRRGIQLYLLVAMACVGLGMISACGGAGGGGGGGTPVTSTVTVTATSGSLQQTTSVSLTVN